MTNIYLEMENLLRYGLEKHLFEQEDQIYVRNRLLSLFGLNDWKETEPSKQLSPISSILENILDWAYQNGHLKTNTTMERDILDTEIMNCLMPRPSEVLYKFNQQYEKGPEEATNYYYGLSKASNYIRENRVMKNKQWKTHTPYGEIDITINLSKPEKDPKEIALLRDAPSSSYPTCLLCKENEGFKGTIRHPARGTHRIIPIGLNNESWYLQYSPYVYYNEHSIVFRKEHVPMKISRQTFNRLLDFTEIFPHYLIGSNADLPIVGGSILSHDHFQGGRYKFALEKAEMTGKIKLKKYPSVTIGMVNWPMSVVRVQGEKQEVAEVTELIFKKWQGYSDPSVDIIACSGGTPHNTVTPIARRRGELFEMDVVLRNNRSSLEFPDGIFHPHKEIHHIKKENIGLIEVMGLAVLPGRLAEELQKVAGYLLAPVNKEDWEEDLLKHWDWYKDIQQKDYRLTKENVMDVIEAEVGSKFLTVLEHAGVFKQTELGKQAFARFLELLRVE